MSKATAAISSYRKARLSLVNPGDRFGRLVVVERLQIKNTHRSWWKLVCDCGQETVSSPDAILSGRKRSCNCYGREVSIASGRSTAKHNMSSSDEYHIWSGMRTRCRNPKSDYWDRYGGRGITVCDRWAKFQNFFADMGRRPSSEHSLDRINNDGNYEPDNCRWATRSEQRRNQAERRFRDLSGMQCGQYTVIRLFRKGKQSGAHRWLVRGTDGVERVIGKTHLFNLAKLALTI